MFLSKRVKNMEICHYLYITTWGTVVTAHANANGFLFKCIDQPV